MTAADLLRVYGLKPDDLVVQAGAGPVGVLRELHRFGCRVLAVDPSGRVADPAIDTLRTTLTPTAARVVRDRYGPVRLLLADADVAPEVRTTCLAADGEVVVPARVISRAA